MYFTFCGAGDRTRGLVRTRPVLCRGAVLSAHVTSFKQVSCVILLHILGHLAWHLNIKEVNRSVGFKNKKSQIKMVSIYFLSEIEKSEPQKIAIPDIFPKVLEFCLFGLCAYLVVSESVSVFVLLVENMPH